MRPYVSLPGSMTLPPNCEEASDARNLPLVVYCSGNFWASPIGSDRQVAARLARTARVLYVDPPLAVRPGNIGALRAPALAHMGDNLWRLSPKSPPGVTRLIGRSVAVAIAKRSIRRCVDLFGTDVHAVVVSSLDPLLGVCETSRRVFYGTDDFRAGAELMGLSPRWVKRREGEQLASASAVVAVSEQLAERWRELGFEVATIPNGCDVDGFVHTDLAQPAADISLRPPIAGLVGQLNDRIDFDVLDAVADLGVSVLLVGPISEPVDRKRFNELIDRPNVQWVDRRPFDQMPSYLKAIKVGLTPYTDSEFNRGSSPLKTLEYLAAGRTVVASDLPAARGLGTDLVAIAKDPKDFARRVSEQLAADDNEELRARRRAFASSRSWEHRVDEFRGVLGIREQQ